MGHGTGVDAGSRDTQDTHDQHVTEAYEPIKQLFRPAGAPAGSWPHTQWTVCVFEDPYERINFWSHFLPGAAFLVIGLLAHLGLAAGGEALWVFCCCAATTHLLSSIMHVYPDDHFLEKLDHIGIVALIVGTPLTQMMALDPSGDRGVLLAASAALLLAAFLPPLLRTTGFIGIGAVMVQQLWHIVDLPLIVQCLLYVAGGVCFIRNGGHDRFMGLQDHHLLHYKVTIACTIHVLNIMAHTYTSSGEAGSYWHGAIATAYAWASCGTS